MLLSTGIQHARAQDKRETFEPTWESLNARHTPQWFADAKFGIFIHWGVYSVPAICDTSTYSEWYQWWLKTNSHNGLVRNFHNRWYGEDFSYRDFAPQFRAELWDPTEWAGIFKDAGAKYVVLVSKHHDGFALWPSDIASESRGYAWNSMQVGPQRDLCGELAHAVREAGMRMGFYYSFMEWENPIYDGDKQRYVEQHMIPQIKDLLERYETAIFWPDGEWNEPDTLWGSKELLAWIYNNCPNPEEIVVNDRWGKGLRGHSGDYYTTEYGHVPWAEEGASDDAKPWEECRGIGHSFAWNRLENLDHYLDRDALIQMLIDVVSRGGNLLLNIGPRADGKIPVIQQDRLAALGDWLKVHGDAIYGTSRGPLEQLSWGRTTLKGDRLFLHLFEWPEDDVLLVRGLLSGIQDAVLMHDSNGQSLPITQTGDSLTEINLTGHHPFAGASVVELTLAEPLRVDEPPAVAQEAD